MLFQYAVVYYQFQMKSLFQYECSDTLSSLHWSFSIPSTDAPIHPVTETFCHLQYSFVTKSNTYPMAQAHQKTCLEASRILPSGLCLTTQQDRKAGD